MHVIGDLAHPKDEALFRALDAPRIAGENKAVGQ